MTTTRLDRRGRLSSIASAFVFLVVACAEKPEVPVDRMLWRTTAAWSAVSTDSNDRRRTAPATIVVFRSNREFVEVRCWLIEQPDETVYISAGQARVAAVGRWREEGGEIRAAREKVARRGRRQDAREPLCEGPELAFRISGNSVIVKAGDAPGTYSPVTRLVAPDFNSYADQARESGTSCVREE